MSTPTSWMDAANSTSNQGAAYAAAPLLSYLAIGLLAGCLWPFTAEWPFFLPLLSLALTTVTAAVVDYYCSHLCPKNLVCVLYAICAAHIGSVLSVQATEERPQAFFIDAQCRVERAHVTNYGQSVHLSVQEQFQEQVFQIRRRVHVWMPAVPALSQDDRIRVRGLCQWNATYQQWSLRLGDLVAHEKRHQQSRAGMWQAIQRLPRHHDLASALWLGIAPQAAKRQFRDAGIAHVLVVSGMHVGMVFIICAMFLRVMAVPWWPAQIMMMAVLAYYLWLTGFAIPTQRAVVMAAVLIIANMLGRDLHRFAALSLSVIILLLIDPLSAREIGFQFSVAAVAGIVTLGLSLRQLRVRYLPLQAWPLDRPVWRFLLFSGRATADALCVGIAASLAIAPLLAAHIGLANPWSPLATVVVTPIIALILASGAVYLFLASLWATGPWQGFIVLCDWFLSALDACSHFFAAWQTSVIAVSAPPIVVAISWPLLFVPCPDLKDLYLRLVAVGVLLGYWAMV